MNKNRSNPLLNAILEEVELPSGCYLGRSDNIVRSIISRGGLVFAAVHLDQESNEIVVHTPDFAYCLKHYLSSPTLMQELRETIEAIMSGYPEKRMGVDEWPPH